MRARLPLAAAAVAIAAFAAWWALRPGGAEVTVYTSVDQVYAEPILRDFEARTGIRVNALYDAEASKTVGLVTRLAAEREAPRADVFWNGAALATAALARDGLLAPYRSPAAEDLPAEFRGAGDLWTGFGGRARVLIVNTALLPGDARPGSVLDLPARAGEVAVANPLFGSTRTHAAALAAALGPEAALELLAALAAQGTVVDGNAVVRDMVASGRVPMGLTDTDDACVAIERGDPVAVVFLDQGAGDMGTLVIPNSVALVAGAPHPEAARALIDDLLSPETEAALVASGWVQVPSRPLAAEPRCYGALTLSRMALPMDRILAASDAIEGPLRDVFQR